MCPQPSFAACNTDRKEAAVTLSLHTVTPRTDLADVHVNPNDNGLPGVSAAVRIVGALLTFGLLAAVAGIAIGAIVWALGSHTSNPHHASRGKAGVLVSAGAAILVGSADAIVNFFSHTQVS
jgi:hypothetical protein